MTRQRSHLQSQLPKAISKVLSDDQIEKIFLVSCGGRSMELKFGKYTRQVNAYVFDNTPALQRISGRTTALFIKAKRIIINEVNRDQRPYSFIFDTGYSKMKEWALATGKEIFHWEKIIDEISGLFIAVTTINPQPCVQTSSSKAVR